MMTRHTTASRVRISAVLTSSAAALLVLGTLAGCAAETDGGSTAGGTDGGSAQIGGDIVAPEIIELSDLAGANVELVVGQALVVHPEESDRETVTGTVTDASVAKFEQGKTDGDASFWPGFTALAVGETAAMVTGGSGGDVEFTITVGEK